MSGPVGRDAERDVVVTFLAAASYGPAVLAIDGEPGIGKSTLCRYAVELSEASGSTVLVCRPTEAESMMSFAGLTDLVSGIADDALAALPVPQYHALAVAALREEPSDPSPDERAVGTGLATLLTQLAHQAPVVVVIDDAQWLDAPSLDVLQFAVRRTTGVRVGLLVSRRVGPGAGTGLAAAMTESAWRREMTLGGLTMASLFHIVREQADVTLARPALLRVSELSAGNPFLALELARSGGSNLSSLVVDRLSQLSDGAREALLAIACSPQPTLGLIEDLGLRGHLDEAEAAGVVAVGDRRVRFSHPLLASASIDAASPSAVRAMHARLGAIATDAEAAARHLALATSVPDDAVAAALDIAAESAAKRGASIAAVELARLAMVRTEDADGLGAWTRRVRVAELLYTAGDTAGAAGLLDRLADACPPGPVRGRGWITLLQVAYQTSSLAEARACGDAALSDAGDDAVLRATALLSLAVVSDDTEERVRLTTDARDTIESASIDDPALVAWVLSEGVSARFAAGEGLDRAAIDRALEVERTGRMWTADDQVAAVRPVLLKWADYQEEALAALLELRTRAEDEGNAGILPYCLGHIPGILVRLGRVDEAAAVAAEHLFHAEATGQDGQRMQAMSNVAFVDAYRGRLDDALAVAKEVLEWADRFSDSWLEMAATGLIGFIALSRGNASDAGRAFERWASARDRTAALDPGISRYYGDEIEALIAIGEIDAATAKTELLKARAVRSGRVSAEAIAARCGGLLAALEGDHDAACAHLDTALRLDDKAPQPFERARTMLAKGVVHRRAKEKRAANDALSAAKAGFAALGALAWVDRADGELRRVGRRPTTSLELTETERRVAELVASGLTNRQVAEQAFISPKTVEANLAKVYRKLGIASRAELGARMASGKD